MCVIIRHLVIRLVISSGLEDVSGGSFHRQSLLVFSMKGWGSVYLRIVTVEPVRHYTRSYNRRLPNLREFAAQGILWLRGSGRFPPRSVRTHVPWVERVWKTTALHERKHLAKGILLSPLYLRLRNRMEGEVPETPNLQAADLSHWVQALFQAGVRPTAYVKLPQTGLVGTCITRPPALS